jgi:hypothetical protein
MLEGDADDVLEAVTPLRKVRIDANYTPEALTPPRKFKIDSNYLDSMSARLADAASKRPEMTKCLDGDRDVGEIDVDGRAAMLRAATALWPNISQQALAEVLARQRKLCEKAGTG